MSEPGAHLRAVDSVEHSGSDSTVAGVTAPPRRGGTGRFLRDVLIKRGYTEPRDGEAIEKAREAGVAPERLLLDQHVITPEQLWLAIAERLRDGDHCRAVLTRCATMRPPAARAGYRARRMIVTEEVSSYLEQLQPHSDSVLAEMEAQAEREGIPIVVAETGALLHVLALARGARRILEVGTAIGVSTLYLARALPEDGKIVSFEIDPERQAAARGYLARAGVIDRADLRLQDAREGLQELQGSFDMAFIDGVKAQYGEYFDLLLPLLSPGAVLTVDNVLMSGTVAEGRSDGHWTDEQIAGARAFNERVLGNEQLAGTLTPVGDGVLIAIRR